jgi:hypothetical protein
MTQKLGGVRPETDVAECFVPEMDRIFRSVSILDSASVRR